MVSPVTDGQGQSPVGEKEGVKILDDAVMQPLYIYYWMSSVTG